MKLDKKERLILINQYKILSLLDADSSGYYQELIKILENGYEIFYSTFDQWIDDDMPVDKGKFVLEILDLYRSIEDIKRKSKDKSLMIHNYSFFQGFDGNNESEYMAFARFLIDVQGKFVEQKEYLIRNDSLNSHMPMVEKYERMLAKSKDIHNIWNMTVQDALNILNA